MIAIYQAALGVKLALTSTSADGGSAGDMILCVGPSYPPSRPDLASVAPPSLAGTLGVPTPMAAVTEVVRVVKVTGTADFRGEREVLGGRRGSTVVSLRRDDDVACFVEPLYGLTYPGYVDHDPKKK